MIAIGGLVCLWHGDPLVIVGVLLVALGIASAGLCYAYDRHSIRRKRAQYDFWIERSFQNLHCRDHRTLIVHETGFRLTCSCGEVSRPWSELLSFTETNSLFVIGTKKEAHLIPKSAFSSEGAITEFRTTFRERLEQCRTMIGQLVDFKYERSDYRNAVFLHIISGGGWRLLAKSLFGIVAILAVILAVWDYARAHGAAIGFIGGGIGVLIHQFLKHKSRPKYLGVQKVFLGADGIQLEDHGTTGRVPWNSFAGFLEDGNVFLLYYLSGRYRLIPKRALAGREAVGTMIREHLPLFDYRRLPPQ